MTPTSTPTETTHPGTRWTRFLRHYLVMVAAMYAGMLVLDPVYAAVATRAGYPDPWTGLPVLSALVMAVNMTVPMVLLMSHHHHGGRATCEMAGSMIAPTLAAAALHAVGAIPAGQVMTVAHLGMFLGLLSQVPLGSLHPHREYANDSAAAFHEYAHSQDWVLVHLGQFLGVLLLLVGLATVATALVRQRGAVGFLGTAAAVAAVTSAAVFAVQMAVDGVALKAAVDTWASATGTLDRDVAFRVAESVRSLEKGLSALFNITNGLTVSSLGTGLILARGPGRRLGWVAVVAGVGLVAVGATTARTGFSHEATSLMVPTTASLGVFVVGMAITAWRRGRTPTPALGPQGDVAPEGAAWHRQQV